jgi:hypothetical protein
MKSWIFIGLLLTVMCGGAYVYYTTTQRTIQALVSNNATLEANVITAQNANQVNLDTIDEMQRIYQEIQNDYLRLESEFQLIRSQNNQLRERLGRHNLGALAFSRPGLVERRINEASRNAARCFELLSGAPLTETERNATNERQFNSECSWLWPGHSSNP